MRVVIGLGALVVAMVVSVIALLIVVEPVAATQPAVWAFIGVVVGGLITGIVSIAAELLRGWRESSLDSAKRADDRRLARDGFQRDNLIALQESLVEWLRVFAIAYVTDEDAFREGRTPVVFPPDFVEKLVSTGARMTLLTDRVVDDPLRERFSGLLAVGAALLQAQTSADLTAAHDRIETDSIEAMAHTGEVLRSYLVERPA